ncbi:hypothetical protein [Microvirga puerhi]|uniref:DUF308 domain-containing protein n=1 Tax=Microvirga puerhi TaxID=2876078 RepID=A0ABS7VMY6_9HYPH|nr:hypothetical protein [Microvirga puerhi]MBZ6076362.1 hypothetical protein [Microvirga puerhi]
MVIALFALALAMIVGGVFAAVLGWDIVLVERGWTMVIAGSISAASGALLLGVATIVSRLSHIQDELMRLQSNLVEDEETHAAQAGAAAAGMSLAALAGGLLGRSAAERAPSEAEPAKDEQPSLPLFSETESAAAKGAPAEAALSEAEPVLSAHEHEESDRLRSYERPAFRGPEIAAPPQVSEAAPPSREEPAPEPDVRVPDFLIAERSWETRYTEVQPPEPARPFAFPEREPEQAPEEREPEPDVAEDDDVLQREPEAREEVMKPVEERAEEAASEPAGARTIIGSYNSGDNRYVMFSDGSIEAETPQGLFRFKSLDELKEFISTGQGGVKIT